MRQEHAATPAEAEIEVEKLGSFFKVKDSKTTSGLQGGAEGQLISLASFWLIGKTDFKDQLSDAVRLSKFQRPHMWKQKIQVAIGRGCCWSFFVHTHSPGGEQRCEF